jgi:hypothetical protein
MNKKGLRSPRINSKESIPPAYVAWRASTTTLYSYSLPSPHRLFKNSSTGPKLAPVVLYNSTILMSMPHELPVSVMYSLNVPQGPPPVRGHLKKFWMRSPDSLSRWLEGEGWDKKSQGGMVSTH